MVKKRICILGSTGSIGRQALEVIALFPEHFQVVGLSAGENLELLVAQIKKFEPKIVSIADGSKAKILKAKLSSKIKIVSGEAGLMELATLRQADLILMAISGSVGLQPILGAISFGKEIALANKESLVMAGKLIMESAKRRGAQILPIDSEHSAIFQLLEGRSKEQVERVVLSASGGPFLRKSQRELKRVRVSEALNHPTWKMGKKISVDSATLMNKSLELIEAKCLFGLKPEQLEVVIHPESIVHSLIMLRDGSVFAQLSMPDMRIPIAYALFYPKRLGIDFPRLNLTRVRALHFEKPDTERFPALKLGYHALQVQKSLPIVMNAVNEEAVNAFLLGKIGFNRIMELVEKVMDEHKVIEPSGLKEILEIDNWARNRTKELIDG